MAKFTKLKKLSPWRKLALVTWKRSWSPVVYGWHEFNAEPAIKYLEELNKNSKNKLTITHMVSKALGMCFAENPAFNGIIKWGNIYKRDSVDVFLQVAIKNDKYRHSDHLSGAKINNIDKKSLDEIAGELQGQAQDIREENDPQFQKIFDMTKWIPTWVLKAMVRMNEFLVFNLGIHAPSLGIVKDPFGSAMVTSVGALETPPGLAPLVPPSRCPFIMCIGLTEKKAKVIDNQIVIQEVLPYTVTFDHRFVDGLTASRLYKRFSEIVENPEKYF